MELEKVATLLSDNLKNIFAFSLSRLYDKSEAEDLTNDIICEVLKCAHRLKNDDAFSASCGGLQKILLRNGSEKATFKR